MADLKSMERREQFEDALQAHWPGIVRLGMLMFSNELEAEEIAQETFFKAFAAWDAFEGRSSVRTWLFRIAINACRRHLATTKRFQGESLDNRPDLAMPQADRREEERKDQASQAMKRLSPPSRLILTLFCIDGLKHQEIASILSVPEGTVWSRLHKAKQEFRQVMQSIEERS